MLNAGKYEFVHRFFEKMKKGGITPQALTYKGIIAIRFSDYTLVFNFLINFEQIYSFSESLLARR